MAEFLERRLLLSSVALATESLFSAGPFPQRAVTMDLNGDGKPDLITSSYYSTSVGVLLGIGNGTFGPVQTFAAGTGPYGMALADLNGDGKPDLAVADTGTATVGFLLGNGDGTLSVSRSHSMNR